jgi:hypothetical protein
VHDGVVCGAFQAIALLFLAALLAMPFLSAGRRPASGEVHSVDL